MPSRPHQALARSLRTLGVLAVAGGLTSVATSCGGTVGSDGGDFSKKEIQRIAATAQPASSTTPVAPVVVVPPPEPAPAEPPKEVPVLEVDEGIVAKRAQAQSTGSFLFALSSDLVGDASKMRYVLTGAEGEEPLPLAELPIKSFVSPSLVAIFGETAGFSLELFPAEAPFFAALKPGLNHLQFIASKSEGDVRSAGLELLLEDFTLLQPALTSGGITSVGYGTALAGAASAPVSGTGDESSTTRLHLGFQDILLESEPRAVEEEAP